LMEILVVEDDPVIGKSVHTGFSDAGHQCVWVKNGIKGLELSRSQQFDVIVLDLLLPGEAGLEILKTLREEGIQTPVIILTALGSLDERVQGLRNGADDYVVKPFAMVELLARIEAVRRRTLTRPAATLKIGDLCLELTTRRVTIEEVELDLTPTEFSLLEILMRHAGQVVTRKMLCEHLWELDWEGATNVVEVHINRLRGKLQRGSKEPLIQTIRGRGYSLRSSA
jgi:DNA-binding response OmpR family regulator